MFGWGNRNAFPLFPRPTTKQTFGPITPLFPSVSITDIGCNSPSEFEAGNRDSPSILNFIFLFLPSSSPDVSQFFPSRFLLLLLNSPSGKLVQIEHALTAVGSGQTSLGIKAANGVVIATEKKLPSILVDETSVQKIQCLTPNIGVVYSGMGPDFRVLVRKSRKQAEQYHRLYKLKVEYEKGTSEKNGNVVYHYFFTCLMIHGLAAMF
ncbi:probable proteasome subunit alpha type-7 isoform X1 [Gossypium hirsutum]|uniref:Probable proteasome subunit alpha type-7 isoform X1 n=1 Tax=Gossypium hirsutum TaxID=3635 RepID=A0ABM3ANB4_GOSHI|nr:probable proteasome subunit alpha type-7 isoform X1 [Gossypium hirsutum]